MTGRIKVRGDLLLAQQLEQVFEKANGRKVRHCLSLKEWHTHLTITAKACLDIP